MHVLLEKRDSVAVVTLNRPADGNALSNALRDELEAVFAECRQDDAVRALVLTGAGSHFSSGYDLEEAIATKLASFQHRILEYHCAMYLMPKPVVTAARGFTLAGGFDLALAGDYILAAEKTVFGHPEIKFGATPLVTSLARKVGPARALELILKGDTINSKKALELGIINEIAPTDRLLDRAVRVAAKFGRWNSRTTGIVKGFANELFTGDVRESLRREFQVFEELAGNEGELLEALKAYYASLG